jgi:hypothetical protein
MKVDQNFEFCSGKCLFKSFVLIQDKKSKSFVLIQDTFIMHSNLLSFNPGYFYYAFKFVKF